MEKTILYLHVSAQTKRWLKALAKKQPGKVSLSTMAEQIFTTRAANSRKKKSVKKH